MTPGNDEAPRQGRPDHFADRSLTDYRLSRIVEEIERMRAGIWHALDALEDGDLRLACDLLLALVEERRAA